MSNGPDKKTIGRVETLSPQAGAALCKDVGAGIWLHSGLTCSKLNTSTKTFKTKAKGQMFSRIRHF